MSQITSISELETLYGDAVPAALTKVATLITPHYQKWIEAARFVVISTVGPDGTDASPRGDDASAARIADTKTLLIPDWRGNNRLDSLRNIVGDERVSLMFMVHGCSNVVRVNGTAVLSKAPELTASFEKMGNMPRTVIVISIKEIYFQCAKAIMRSELWSGRDESSHVPTAGDFLKEMKAGFDGQAFDSGYDEYAKPHMW